MLMCFIPDVKGKKQYKSKVLLKFANLVLKITPGIGF
jgi:hypothetical protein